MISIEWSEHNATNLMDLVEKNGIIIHKISAGNPHGTDIDGPLYSLSTQLLVEGSFQEICGVLDSSDEFKWHNADIKPLKID